jgi:ribosomal protein S18 acetylase RimI-like enzyme
MTIRKATAQDMRRIAEIIAGDPGTEAIGIAGNARAARRFGVALYSLPGGSGDWRRTVIAELNGEVVGVIQAGPPVGQVKVTTALVWMAVRTVGPFGVLRALPRMKARDRVHVDPPEGSCYIAEVDVDPRYRGQGIGGALLDYAEAGARHGSYKQMSLSTTTSNPARRLYERHGFRVVETKTDAQYERYTGIEGRLLMVKDLD